MKIKLFVKVVFKLFFILSFNNFFLFVFWDGEGGLSHKSRRHARGSHLEVGS